MTVTTPTSANMAEVKKINMKDEMWDPKELSDPEGKPWKKKTLSEKLNAIGIVLFKIAVLLGLLYLFVCSIGLLSDAFRLLGGKAAGAAFRESKILNNPLSNLMMGVLATVLLQSSSTTTSIVVSMVSVELVPVNAAIFIIMGANIGTSVTNTIVSIGQVGNRDEFRRAFAGATVHDCFNWLTVLIMLPIEWISSSAWYHCYHTNGGVGNGTVCDNCGILCQVTALMTNNLETPKGMKKQELLKVITKPLQKAIMQLDKNVIEKIALNQMDTNATILKSCYEKVRLPDVAAPILCNFTSINATASDCVINYVNKTSAVECGYLFESKKDSWTDTEVGICLLALALALLMGCLIAIVRLLHSLLKGSLASVIQRFLNSDLPGCFKHLTGYIAILLGMGFTMLLQSSSIFTSAVTPLVGTGVLSLDRMYPLTLGANIGTTFTAILAALASSDIQLSMQVALCHLFFNICGILIWYPIPAMRKVPISCAKILGVKTSKHRWFAIAYLALVFLALPGGVFGLSLAGWEVLLGVGLPLFIIIVAVFVINILQAKAPHVLPVKLRTWDFLPKFLHSLKPYDEWCTADFCKTEEELEQNRNNNGACVNEAYESEREMTRV